MLLANIDWVTLLSDKGLAVAIVVATMFAIWRAVTFIAPLAKDFVGSTVDLHTSLKITSIQQTALMDDHAGKLADIRDALITSRCPMIGQAETKNK